jgi:hypothetical protein
MILPKGILHNVFSDMSYQAFKASHDPADDHETISISAWSLFEFNYDHNNQWRNYYGLRPGEPGGPQPQCAKWGPPGLGDRAKTLASASDMLQCRFLTIRIL